MSLTTLEHFLVLTDRLPATRFFYSTILGLDVGFRPDLGFEGYWMYLDGTAVVHIAERQSYFRRPQKAGYETRYQASMDTGSLDHIAFRGENSGDMIDRLCAHGLEHRVQRIPDIGLTQIFVKDPNGLQIEMNFPDAT